MYMCQSMCVVCMSVFMCLCVCISFKFVQYTLQESASPSQKISAFLNFVSRLPLQFLENKQKSHKALYLPRGTTFTSDNRTFQRGYFIVPKDPFQNSPALSRQTTDSYPLEIPFNEEREARPRDIVFRNFLGRADICAVYKCTDAIDSGDKLNTDW